MGEDHLRKTQREYRRMLQRRAEKHLGPLPLLAANEQVSTRYPCHLVEPEGSVKVGSKVVIFQRSENATVAVLNGNKVIASVDGEAARDLHRLFQSRPKLCRTLRVEVVSITDGTPHFEVAPIKRRPKRSKR